MSKLAVYEFTGIIAPGALTIFGFSRIYPAIGVLVADDKISFGEFGLLLILAYVVGHLVQALGNIVEPAFWFILRGIPTDWPRSDAHGLLAKQQAAALPSKVRDILKIDCPDSLKSLDRKSWFSITRQIYAATKRAGQAERVDIFNGNYGLMRGVAASLFLIAVATTIQSPATLSIWWFPFLLGLALALLRMHRFAVHYARELFVQFLSVTNEKAAEPEPEKSE
ncbi:MAG: hypothetical protein WAK31_04185 [Chthoniobacterales bacterium]